MKTFQEYFEENFKFLTRNKCFLSYYKKLIILSPFRYNDYKHEEFSKCKCIPPYSAEASISTRGDLNPPNGTYEINAMGHRNHGSIDYKVILF